MIREQPVSEKWGNFVLIGLGVMCLQVVGGWLIFHYSVSWDVRGQFGDMFGAVNTLFSGLAFASLIYSLSLQRKDLGLQRSELQMTRIELARSATAQDKSATVAERMEREQGLSTELSILSSKIQASAAVNQALISYLPKANYQPPSSGGDSEAAALLKRIRLFNKQIQDDHAELSKMIADRQVRIKAERAFEADKNDESPVK